MTSRPQASEPIDIDFGIIGAQKCGTTALARLLRSQPGIDVLPGEFDYFEGGPWRSEWRFESSCEVRGFKRPNILPSPGALARMARELPAARYIVILRDPARRAVAAVYHYIRDGFLPLEDPNRLLGTLLTDGHIRGYPRSAEVLDFGLYGRHLTVLLQHVAPDRVLIADQSELRHSDSTVFADLGRFLGQPVDFLPVERTMTTTYDPLRLRVRRTLNPIMFRYNDDRTRLSARSRTLNGVIDLLDERVPNRTRFRRHQVSDAILARLDDYYLKDQPVLDRARATCFRAIGNAD